MHQIAQAVEASINGDTLSSNPLDGDRCWGSRVDLEAARHLVLGRSMHGDAAAATFVEAHVRSFHCLRKTHRRWGKKPAPRVCVQHARGKELCRYMDAGRRFMASCETFAVACDAFRIGGKDILLVAILGFQDARCSIMWAPPQVWLFYRMMDIQLNGPWCEWVCPS